MKLTKIEQETIFLYNQEESTASVYTHDRALINRLDKLCEKSPCITVIKSTNNCREYICPKTWVRVTPPRVLSDEKRQELAKRARTNFAAGKSKWSG